MLCTATLYVHKKPDLLFSSIEMLPDFNNFYHNIQKLSSLCTYSTTGNEYEHVAETIRKLILELNVFQLATIFSRLFMKMNVKW